MLFYERNIPNVNFLENVFPTISFIKDSTPSSTMSGVMLYLVSNRDGVLYQYRYNRYLPALNVLSIISQAGEPCFVTEIDTPAR